MKRPPPEFPSLPSFINRCLPFEGELSSKFSGKLLNSLGQFRTLVSHLATHELPRDILPPSLFPAGRALQRRGSRPACKAAVPSDRPMYRYAARLDAGCWFSSAVARRRRGDKARGVVPEMLETDQNRQSRYRVVRFC